MLRNLIKKLTDKNGKKKGFTLIELIIVIAIIAILAAIALPKFAQYRESANQKDDLAAAKNISTAVSTLIADNKLKVSTENNFDVTGSDQTTPGGKVAALLENGAPTGKSKAADGKSFHVTIDTTTEKVTVTVNSKEVYPKNTLS